MIRLVTHPIVLYGCVQLVRCFRSTFGLACIGLVSLKCTMIVASSFVTLCICSGCAFVIRSWMNLASAASAFAILCHVKHSRSRFAIR